MCAEQFQLEALEKEAREDLLRVGMSLLDEECIEIYNLLVELEASRHALAFPHHDGHFR